MGELHCATGGVIASVRLAFEARDVVILMLRVDFGMATSVALYRLQVEASPRPPAWQFREFGLETWLTPIWRLAFRSASEFLFLRPRLASQGSGAVSRHRSLLLLFCVPSAIA